MADTPDTAQQRYAILTAFLDGAPMEGWNADAMEVEVARALREIDTLTAEVAKWRDGWNTGQILLRDADKRAEKAEAERDALRVVGGEIVERVKATMYAYGRWIDDGNATDADRLHHMEGLLARWRELSPSPVEGDQ